VRRRGALQAHPRAGLPKDRAGARPMSGEILCHYCKEPVDVTDRLGVWQAVWGWAQDYGRRPSGHRISGDLYHRQHFNRWAHAACIKLVKSGGTPGQTTFV
jgi:hypothetical protein